MTSSSKSRLFPNVPPPSGTKQAASPYTRFIPREELGDFERWRPGDIGSEERRAHPRASSAPPTAEEWRAMIAQARATGYQEGYRDGMVALESFKSSFASQTTAQLGQLLSAFDEQLQALESRMAESVARSAVLLAREVLRQELAMRPEAVAALATEAVQAVQAGVRHVTVYVHPEDLPLVEQGAAEVLQMRGARLVAEPSMSRGGVRIQSEADAIDASIETRWQQAASLLGRPMPWTSARPPAAAEAPDRTPPAGPVDSAGQP